MIPGQDAPVGEMWVECESPETREAPSGSSPPALAAIMAATHRHIAKRKAEREAATAALAPQPEGMRGCAQTAPLILQREAPDPKEPTP